MLGTPHLCVLYVATAGLQGNGLGSDEEEIVLLIYVIIDMSRNKVIGVQQYVVKPAVADVNENVLSEQLVRESALTEELVKSAGQPLHAAILQFDQYARSLQLEPNSPLFRFVTDGQLPLRQSLHPEACSKQLDLPDYYNVFHDLRKDFRAFYNAPAEEELNSITDLVNYLGMPQETESDLYIRSVQDMVNIVLRLIADGHCFSTPETIQIKLEPGICTKDEEVDNNCVVRARGLPWQSSDKDIAEFFRGLNVAKGGVALCLSPQGRRNGEALVRFINQEHRDMALKRHKHHINNRYIEVYKASGEDFVNVAGGCNNEAQAFLTRGAQVIVRMRGLPYDCTAKQVIEFFECGGENHCIVMDGEEGVLFVKKPDGRATGDAFVLFAHEDDSVKALSKHRELIGTRYIELFRSTTAEVQQVLNRSMDPKTFELQMTPVSLPPMPQPVPLLPQHIITSGTRKDCVRLRGLPYEAQVEHILEFLGDHAKNIVFQGVHMVYNAQGQPSGEAFIQMDSEGSAFITAQQKHHRYMVFGKKQRYIEVFQCSGEDMSMVLTGIPSVTAVSTVSPVGKALLSPGMLPPPPPTNSLAVAPPPPTVAPPPMPVAQVAASPVSAAHAAVAQWDPLVAAAVQQNRQQQLMQQDFWLMNQLVAQQQHAAVAQQQQHAAVAHQQQQHALALATFAAKQNSAAHHAAAAQWQHELVHSGAPPPISSSSIVSPVNTKHMTTFPQHTAQLFSPHIPPPTPVFFLNMPPPQQHPHYAAATAKMQQPAYALPHMSLIHPTAAPPPPILNLKRSWEQAFPNATTDVNSNTVVKRPYPAVSAAPPMYAAQPAATPVGVAAQNHAAQHPGAVSFQSTPAFYAAM